MANLETLELTISSNATGAKQGIDGLISSLSALPAIVRNAATELKGLNEQLAKLKRFQGFKMPSIGGSLFSGGKKASSGFKAKGGANVGQPDPKLLAQGWTPVPANAVPQNVRDAVKNTMSAMKDAGKESVTFGKKVSKAFDKIGRIASTMVTRMALKALIKNLTEAWKSAYDFSKKMGGDFAKNVDKVRGSLGNMATNIIRAFSPLMSIIAPIFSVMATGINYLTQAIAELLKLLGIAGDLLGSTAEKIGGVGSDSKKAAKDVVAGFDELNVIDSTSSGGGGSGGGSTFTTKFKEEIDAIKMIVAESMLAVGLILAFSGHVGIGLALAAVGAATIVGTIVEKWGTLSEKVKGEITTIMAIAGGAMLALGLILAFTGHVGLGVALIAAGAANMVASVALSWNLSSEIKREVSKIMGIVGGSLLAIGAILALTGVAVPLGVAMMAAGGVSLIGAASLNWDALKNGIVTTFNIIKDKLVKAWDNVKSAVSNAWESVKTWASAKWDDMKAGWEEIKNKLKYAWEIVKYSIGTAWDKYMSWTGASWSDLQQGWTNIKNNLYSAWTYVKKSVSDAWNSFKDWIGAKWSQLSSGWSLIKDNLVNYWGLIKNAVYYAWGNVKNWISITWSSLNTAWTSIKNNLITYWEMIKKSVSNAWTAVKDWISAKWSQFSETWNDIGTKLSSVWDGIKGYVGNAWESVKLWYQTAKGSVIDKIKTAWEGVKDWFYNSITKPIANFFRGLVNGVIEAMNWLINKLNKLGNIHWDSVEVLGATIIPSVDVKLFEIPTIAKIPLLAEGQYGIPSGQLFIANEAGAEMIGTMDGHTTVANQQEIVDGIKKGVYEANAEQNALLMEQNNLLRGILQKDSSVRLQASAAFGRVARQSLDMYSTATGV